MHALLAPLKVLHLAQWPAWLCSEQLVTECMLLRCDVVCCALLRWASQWVGTFDFDALEFASEGRVFNFPRDNHCDVSRQQITDAPGTGSTLGPMQCRHVASCSVAGLGRQCARLQAL